MSDGMPDANGPQRPDKRRNAMLEIAGEGALEGARTLAGLALHALGIVLLLVLGAAGVGAGLWYGLGWLAIAGGVLMAGALLWALVLGLVLWMPPW